MDRGFLLVVQRKSEKCKKNGRFKYPLKQPYEFVHLFLVESYVCLDFQIWILPACKAGVDATGPVKTGLFQLGNTG